MCHLEWPCCFEISDQSPPFSYAKALHAQLNSTRKLSAEETAALGAEGSGRVAEAQRMHLKKLGFDVASREEVRAVNLLESPPFLT